MNEIDSKTYPDDEAWKIFNRDTEAGRLLSRLYGVAPAGKVSYPKQRRRRRVTDSNANDIDKEKPPARSWKTTYTVNGWSKRAEDEKQQERKENIARALSLAVPKVGRGFGEQRHSVNGSASQKMLHQMPRRKTALTCRKECEETLQKNRHYRPPNSNNMMDEKERLNDIFGKGGNCLPEDLTNKQLRSSKSSANSKTTRPSTLFDQIYQEILERRKHQMALEKLGSGEATREEIAKEISERLQELKSIDPKRALSVVQKLMKS